MYILNRRNILIALLTGGVAAGGLGLTAGSSRDADSSISSQLEQNTTVSNQSVEAQADVQAEQALTVAGVSVSGDADASFTRMSDDNTQFQAAVELNNGDGVLFNATLENSAADELAVQVAVDVPDAIDVDVRNKTDSLEDDGTEDLDPDDDGTNGNAVQTGEGTFVAKISSVTEQIGVFAELDDTANSGSYDIGVAINPLSTDDS
jgi:hypothetical protein